MKENSHDHPPLHHKSSTTPTREQLRSHISFEKTPIDSVADFFTNFFGSFWFLITNAVFFIGWIVLNTPEFGFIPFDPYPFGLLTMAVSLEAIFLSILVLMSQNRQSRMSDIRQRVNFEVDVRAEAEVTKVLKMLAEIQEHLGIQKKDPELHRMEKNIDLEKIQIEVEKLD